MHRAVHIFLMDSRGRLWIEKRGPNVDTCPLYYDCSAAGHVAKGETYEQAAEREVAEELGIRGLKLVRAFDLPASEITMNEFQRFFVAMSDEKPRLHEDAYSQELYTISEIEEKMRRGEKFTPTFAKFLAWCKENMMG